MKKLMIALMLALVIVLVPSSVAFANTPESSTMHFEGDLEEGDGGYVGIVPMIEDYGGYDVYAEEGATAWFGDGVDPVWTDVAIEDHDAFPNWDTDTPDWYQYSVRFYEEEGASRWRVANHSGTTAENPWYDAGVAEQGVPMSGTMDWSTMYATETDVGEYLPPINPLTHPEIPGGAATQGGGAQAWDMDWSWGSEVIPLQYPGFTVDITDLGDGNYQIVMVPAPMPPAPIPAPTEGYNRYKGLSGVFWVEVFNFSGFDTYKWDDESSPDRVLAGDVVAYGKVTGVNAVKCVLYIPEGTHLSFPGRPGTLVTNLLIKMNGEVHFSPENVDFSQTCEFHYIYPDGTTEVVTFTEIRDGSPVS